MITNVFAVKVMSKRMPEMLIAVAKVLIELLTNKLNCLCYTCTSYIILYLTYSLSVASMQDKTCTFMYLVYALLPFCWLFLSFVLHFAALFAKRNEIIIFFYKT